MIGRIKCYENAKRWHCTHWSLTSAFNLPRKAPDQGLILQNCMFFQTFYPNLQTFLHGYIPILQLWCSVGMKQKRTFPLLKSAFCNIAMSVGKMHHCNVCWGTHSAVWECNRLQMGECSQTFKLLYRAKRHFPWCTLRSVNFTLWSRMKVC